MRGRTKEAEDLWKQVQKLSFFMINCLVMHMSISVMQSASVIIANTILWACWYNLDVLMAKSTLRLVQVLGN